MDLAQLLADLQHANAPYSSRLGPKYLYHWVGVGKQICRRVPNPRRHGKYGKVGFCSGKQECARRRMPALRKMLQHQEGLRHD